MQPAYVLILLSAEPIHSLVSVFVSTGLLFCSYSKWEPVPRTEPSWITAEGFQSLNVLPIIQPTVSWHVRVPTAQLGLHFN